MCEHYLISEESSGEWSQDEEEYFHVGGFLDDDDSEDDAHARYKANRSSQQRIEDDIRKLMDNSLKETGRNLRESAFSESQLTGGMHVWTGVKNALEMAFPGWPDDTAQHDAFREKVQRELAVIKACRCDQEAALMRFIDSDAAVKQQLTMFLKYAPFSAEKRKTLNYGVLKVMAKGVKYANEEARGKYLVTLGPQIMRGDAIFDTAELWNRKIVTTPAGSASQSKNKDKKKRCIWVMTMNSEREANFYSHFPKLGRFHHSSFTGGSPVMAAGEWFVEKGVCTLINSCSGHYQPPPWRFRRACNELVKKGVLTPQTEIMVWERSEELKVVEHRFSACEFLNNLGANLQHYQLYPPNLH